MTFHIRHCDISDAENIGRTHAIAWQETYPGIVPDHKIVVLGSPKYRIEQRRAIFASSAPQSGHFCIEDLNGEIVGFGDCGPALDVQNFAPAEIFALYILQKTQSCGLGKKLLNIMLGYLADKGFKSAALKTHIGNLKAQLFYVHCSGQAAGQIDGVDWAEMVYVWPDLKNFTRYKI